MKTNNSSLLTKSLLVLGIFSVTTFITYGAVSTPGGMLKSTPYQSINTAADATLSRLTNGSGSIILDGVIAKVKAQALEKGGSPMNVATYNAYIDTKLSAIDALDNEVSGAYGSDYTFLFQYFYPRVYALKLPEASTASILDKISSVFGGNVSTGSVSTNTSLSGITNTGTIIVSTIVPKPTVSYQLLGTVNKSSISNGQTITSTGSIIINVSNVGGGNASCTIDPNIPGLSSSFGISGESNISIGITTSGTYHLACTNSVGSATFSFGVNIIKSTSTVGVVTPTPTDPNICQATTIDGISIPSGGVGQVKDLEKSSQNITGGKISTMQEFKCDSGEQGWYKRGEAFTRVACSTGYIQSGAGCANATTFPDSQPFFISAVTTVKGIVISFKIDKTLGYKGCTFMIGDTIEGVTLTKNGAFMGPNTSNVGLGSYINKDGTFGGAFFTSGGTKDLGYNVNLYCQKDDLDSSGNMTYAKMKKIITSTKLSSIVSSPITTITISDIPGNTNISDSSASTNTNIFNISATKTSDDKIKLDYNIPASTGYKTCVITAGDSKDMMNIIDGSVITGGGMSSGLGSSDTGFNGSKYYGSAGGNLYLNVYCAKVSNAKFTQLEKIIPSTKLNSIINSAITTINTSQIPGNTGSSSPTINHDEYFLSAGLTSIKGINYDTVYINVPKSSGYTWCQYYDGVNDIRKQFLEGNLNIAPILVNGAKKETAKITLICRKNFTDGTDIVLEKDLPFMNILNNPIKNVPTPATIDYVTEIKKMYDANPTAKLYNPNGPDQAVIDYWKKIIIEKGLSTVQNGIFAQQVNDYVKNNPDLFVEYLYTSKLGRASDAGGKAWWINQITSGKTSLEGAAAGFDAAAPTEKLVESWYTSKLGRASDLEGKVYWVTQINSGKSVAEVEAAFNSVVSQATK